MIGPATGVLSRTPDAKSHDEEMLNYNIQIG